MKILVTGGLGYIGTVLSDILLGEGYAITIVDKGMFGTEYLNELSGRPEFIRKDFRSFTAEDLKGFDAVCHLAGLSNDPMANFNPEANDAINNVGAVKFAEECAKAGIERFIFASSAAVYGFQDTNILTEESPVDPKSFYAEAKYNAECGMLKIAEHGTLKPTLLRQATVMGASIRPRFDLVVNTMVKDALLLGRILLVAGGECWRPLVNVVDVAKVWTKLLEMPIDNIKYQTVNVMHKNYRISELGNYVRHCIHTVEPDIPIEVIPDYDSREVRSYSISGERLKQLIGFDAPKTGVIETVQTLWKQLMSEFPDRSDLLNPKYYNIKFLNLMKDMESFFAECGDIF